MSQITSNFHNLQAVQKAMLAKLAGSGLTADDAARLCLTAFTAVEVAAKLAGLPVKRAGFKIPYWDLAGKPLPPYRFRYLEYDNARGFAALVHKNGKPQKHDLRYAQPNGSLPGVYFPPLFKPPWAAVAADARVPLTITEGELKAACACKHQHWTLGLGGVWAWRAAKQGQHLLSVLQEFVWEKRDTIICFDSDAATNPQVCLAQNQLAHELCQLGAVVRIARLPKLDDQEKTGLDDYIAARGTEEYGRILAEAAPWKESEELYKLNEEVVYVKEPGLILVLDTLQRISCRAFVEHAYSTRKWHQQVGEKLIERSASKEWLKWPQRAVVACATYQPGQPRITNDRLNVWPGWTIEPKEGNITLWHDLLEYLFKGHDDSKERRRWFEQWLAYPLQNPGVKLYTAAVVWGVIQGTGKSLVGYTMAKIYGKNFTEINDKHLHGAFNEWAENKQFVMGDEIASSGSRKRDIADYMKGMITQKELRLNPKYIPSYTVPDVINYYFTSNHSDAFFMEDTDRRFFIHEVLSAPQEKQFYDRYCAWAIEGTGASAIFHHLLRLPMKGFDPQAPALFTSSKREMMHDSYSGVEDWVARLRDDPDNVLMADKVPVRGNLFSADVLLTIFNRQRRGDDHPQNRVTTNLLGRKLKSAGFYKACNGATVDGTGLRLWIVRGTGNSPEEREEHKQAMRQMKHPQIAKLYAAQELKIKY